MNKLVINADASQTLTATLADGTTFTFTIEFKPMQLGWFITNLTYGSRTFAGMRVVVSPNFLTQYRNLLPFGLACYSIGNREPALQTDFSNGNATLFLLTEAEVQDIVDEISAQAQ